MPKSSKYHFKNRRILREIGTAYQKSANSNSSAVSTSCNAQPWKPSTGSRETVSMKQKSLNDLSLYKSMDKSCHYFTSSNPCVFKEHLIQHQNNPKTAKDEKNYLKCPYCIIQASNSSTFMEHIESVHKHCSFQCVYCFFRCYSGFQIANHHSYQHRNFEKKVFKMQPNTDKQFGDILTNEELAKLWI